MRAGIIAAGWGTRLGGGPKALTPVGGRALVDHVIEGLLDAGAESLTCIVNEASTAVCEHVARAWPDLPVDWLVQTTPSSMHSFLAVLQRLGSRGDDACLLATVDSVSVPGTLRRFRSEAEPLGAALVLGVTTLVDDEKPLYAVPANAVERGRPFRVGALSSHRGASEYVTAGFYWVSPKILAERDAALRSGFTALRQFLGGVVATGYASWAVPLAAVVDVDRPHDVAAAERLLS